MGLICSEEKEKRNIIQEKKLLDYPHPITDKVKQVMNIQMKNCVCKIITNSSCGTGFFGLIQFPDQKFIRALFTCYHNLETKDKSKIEQSFQYSIGINEQLKEMKINDSRFVYINSKLDIVIIEILESDDLQIDSFLEFNESIYNENEFETLKKICNIKDANSQVTIYLLHFPKFESLSYSAGVLLKISNNYDIDHTCSSECGSSGGPIINLADQKVYGIHKGHFENSNNNAGLFIKVAIEEFIKIYQKSKKSNYLAIDDYNILKLALKFEKEEEVNKSENFEKNNNELNKSINNKISDRITIIYNVDHSKKKLYLFHEDFVRVNKFLKIIINGISIDICSEIDIDLFAIDKDILEIKLIGINEIKSMSYMFAECNDLIGIPDIDNWDTTNVIDMRGLFGACNLLKQIPDISKLNTKNVIDMGEMFKGCKSLLSLPDISKWNTSNVINFSNMFAGCIKLQSLPDISKWDTNKLKLIYGMFKSCCCLQSIPDISKWDVSNAKNIGYLFFGCENLLFLPENISKWNTRNVIVIDCLFAGLYKLNKIPDISNWDISNVIYMTSIFVSCISIQSLPDISKWNTSKVYDMCAIFKGCENLISLPDISKWDVSNVVDMSQMFAELKKITHLPDISNWNTKNVTNMGTMFKSCENLLSFPDISKWNISKAQDLNSMFYGCINLQELPDISKWNTKNVTNMSSMFSKCSSLVSLPKIENWDITNLKRSSFMFKDINPNIIIPRKFIDNDPIQNWPANILINSNFMNNMIRVHRFFYGDYGDINNIQFPYLFYNDYFNDYDEDEW